MKWAIGLISAVILFRMIGPKRKAESAEPTGKRFRLMRRGPIAAIGITALWLFAMYFILFVA